MPDRVLDDLAKKYVFEYEQRIDGAHSCVRFCTSWSTKPEDVDALVADIEALARRASSPEGAPMEDAN